MCDDFAKIYMSYLRIVVTLQCCYVLWPGFCFGPPNLASCGWLGSPIPPRGLNYIPLDLVMYGVWANTEAHLVVRYLYHLQLLPKIWCTKKLQKQKTSALKLIFCALFYIFNTSSVEDLLHAQ